MIDALRMFHIGVVCFTFSTHDIVIGCSSMVERKSKELDNIEVIHMLLFIMRPF